MNSYSMNVLPTTISTLKKGDFFTLRPIENPTDMQVFIKGDYNRSIKKYSCTLYGDINHERFFIGSRPVYTDFCF